MLGLGVSAGFASFWAYGYGLKGLRGRSMVFASWNFGILRLTEVIL